MTIGEHWFFWKFHGFVPVELLVEIPQKVPQKVPRFSACETFCGSSTESSMVFVSVELSLEIQQKAPRICLCGNSTECSTILCQASLIVPSLNLNTSDSETFKFNLDF